ncbi:MAG: hypothetical protein NUV75_11395 [Gallionella sp.]|nr:hypothetical protein [Gallionella sp.]
MTPFEQGWARTGPKEAGYSDQTNDRGGPTKYGVTERVARANGFKGDMRDLPLETAMEIAKTQYWDVLNLDGVAALSLPIAMEMFDTLYNGGDVGAWLQRCLNVLNRGASTYPDMKVDGRIGPMTIAALRAYLAKRGKEGEAVMLKALNAIQGERFIRIAEANQSQENFVYGWLKERA